MKEESQKEKEFEIKNLQKILKEISVSSIFKYFLLIVLLILGISVILALIKFLIFGLSNSTKYYGSFSPPEVINNGFNVKSLSSTNVLERITYSVLIKTNNKKEVLRKIKEKEDYKTVIIESLSDYGNYAYLRVKVEKSKSQDFLKFLKQFNVEELNTNSQKITQQYSSIEDKIKELKQRKLELINRLNEIKKDYQELIKMAKEKGDVETLNKIYDSLNNKEDKIWREIESINNQISNLEKQKKMLEDLNNYVLFNIRIQEEKIIDFKKYKEEWILSLKELANNFNNTLKSIIIGIPNLLLTAVRIIIYIFITTILALITIKALWKVGKKIIKF